MLSIRIAGNAVRSLAVAVGSIVVGNIGIFGEFVLDSRTDKPLSSCAILCYGSMLRPPGALTSRQQMPCTACHIPIDLGGIHGFDNERRGRIEFEGTL